VFLRKRRAKKLPRVVSRQGIPFLSAGLRQGGWVLLFLRRDCDRGALRDFFLWRDHDSGALWQDHYRGAGTSSSSDTTTVGPCGTGTYSSSGGTTTVTGCDSETTSSPTACASCWGPPLPPMCVMPNSSFIISNASCKNCNIPK
jgi:hypothetical protein